MADATYQSEAYRTQGSTAFVVTSSGVFDGSTATGRFLFAAGEIAAADLASSAVTAAKLDATLRKGSVPLNLFAAREVSSTAGEDFTSVNLGLLSSATVPLLGLISTADRTPRISWTSGNSDGIQLPPVVPPPDFTTAAGINVHLTVDKNSTLNQTANIDVQFWPAGSTSESGTVTAAIISTSPTDYSIAIPASVLYAGTAGGIWNVALVPGAHANDAIRVYGASIEYTRQST